MPESPSNYEVLVTGASAIVAAVLGWWLKAWSDGYSKIRIKEYLPQNLASDLQKSGLGFKITKNNKVVSQLYQSRLNVRNVGSVGISNIEVKIWTEGDVELFGVAVANNVSPVGSSVIFADAGKTATVAMIPHLNPKEGVDLLAYSKGDEGSRFSIKQTSFKLKKLRDIDPKEDRDRWIGMLIVKIAIALLFTLLVVAYMAISKWVG